MMSHILATREADEYDRAFRVSSLPDGHLGMPQNKPVLSLRGVKEHHQMFMGWALTWIVWGYRRFCYDKLFAEVRVSALHIDLMSSHHRREFSFFSEKKEHWSCHSELEISVREATSKMCLNKLSLGDLKNIKWCHRINSLSIRRKHIERCVRMSFSRRLKWHRMMSQKGLFFFERS